MGQTYSLHPFNWLSLVQPILTCQHRDASCELDCVEFEPFTHNMENYSDRGWIEPNDQHSLQTVLLQNVFTVLMSSSRATKDCANLPSTFSVVRTTKDQLYNDVLPFLHFNIFHVMFRMMNFSQRIIVINNDLSPASIFIMMLMRNWQST